VFTAAGLWTRAIRWRGLLGFRIPVRRAFHIINIMFLMNQIPLRAGEVARSLLATQEGVPLITAATSIVVERLLDTLLVVVMLAVALSQLPDASAFASNSAALFGVIALIGFAVLIFFARYPQFARNLLALAERILPPLKRLRLQRLLEHFIDGLQPLTQTRSAAHAIIWTIISWTFSFCTFYSLHQAMNIEGVNLILSAAIALALASFSIAIPVSVMAIGPFEAAVVAAGQAVVKPALWGTMQATYTALGFVIHGINLLNYAIWGTIGLVIMGVSLGDLLQARATPSESSEPVAETKTGHGT
jgi:glycosyltransferase 2 family protein